MEIGDIISTAFKYPLNDKDNFVYVLLLFILVGIPIILFSTLITAFIFAGSGAHVSTLMAQLTGVAGIISLVLLLIFLLIAPGYFISVMREGINQTGVIPKIDIGNNILNTLKLIVINFVYYIVPGAIAFILALVFGLLAGGVTSSNSAIFGVLGIVLAIILFIIYFIFALLSTVAKLRFAKTDSMSEAFSFSEVIDDLKQIGILKLIVTSILVNIIIAVFAFIAVFILLIPILGAIIVALILAPFLALFDYYALGLLYSDVA